MIIIYLVSIYLIAGLIFAIPFLLKWMSLLDEAARETTWTFKLTILPGCMVFWPVLLKRYLNR